MIKVIFVENNEIKMSKEEFEKLLEETYNRGKAENYEAAYNKGYKDGYCNSHSYGGLTGTGSGITYLNTADCTESLNSSVGFTRDPGKYNIEDRLEAATQIRAR